MISSGSGAVCNVGKTSSLLPFVRCVLGTEEEVRHYAPFGHGSFFYKVRLNSAVAIVIITIAATVRYSRSARIAANPASFSMMALKPLTA